MKTRVLYAVLAAGLLAALFALFSLSAEAQLRTFLVRLPTGSIIKVTVNAPASVPMSRIPGLPGIPLEEITSGLPKVPTGGGGGIPTTSGGGGGGGGGTTTTPSSGGGGSRTGGGGGGTSNGGN